MRKETREMAYKFLDKLRDISVNLQFLRTSDYSTALNSIRYNTSFKTITCTGPYSLNKPAAAIVDVRDDKVTCPNNHKDLADYCIKAGSQLNKEDILDIKKDIQEKLDAEKSVIGVGTVCGYCPFTKK